MSPCLGSTGSIGRSTLEVIAASGGRLRAVALSAHGNTELLLRQAQAVRPRRIVVDRSGGGRPARLVGAAGRTSNCSSGPRRVARLAADAGSRHRGFGHRRQRRPAGHLGRPGGRQDRGPGQQGEPGGGRAAGDGAGPPQKRQNPARRQRTQRRVSGVAGGAAGRGAAGGAHRQRGAIPHVSRPNSLPKSPWPTPWPIPLGRWDRK